MTNVFDRAYYLRNLERNMKLADEARIPAIREAHLRMAEFYLLALELSDKMEPDLSAVVNL